MRALAVLVFSLAGFISIVVHGQSTDQLAILKSELRHRNIVLLGEPSHSAEFYHPKIEVVKYLHQELGFNVIAFESGMIEMKMVNDLLQTFNPSEVMAKGLFPIWANDPEFLPLLEYLDEQQAAGNPLVISGFDCQPSGMFTADDIINHLTSIFNAYPGLKYQKALAVLKIQLSEIKNTFRVSKSVSAADINELATLELQLNSIAPLAFYGQAIQSWRLYVEHLKTNPTPDVEKFKASDSNFRDSVMALNFSFLNENSWVGKKVIAWGATGHFANELSPLTMNTQEHLDYRPMGWYLKKRFGNKLYTLAVTTTSEEAGTWEGAATKQRRAISFLSTDSLRTKFLASDCLSHRAEGIWSEAIDGLLFLPTRQIHQQVTPLKGRLIDKTNRQPVSFASLWVEGTAFGTASNGDGYFYLNYSGVRKIRVSCIGYKTRYITISDFGLENAEFVLEPEREFLQEVVVKASRVNPQEYVREAIRAVPKNYWSKPFNIEFYSTITTLDSAKKSIFRLESIVEGYYEGYSSKATKHFRVTQKRETGENFLAGTPLQSIWPPFEIISSDLITNPNQNGIFNETYLDKFTYRISKLDMFEGDSVVVIDYELPKTSSKITGYQSALKKYFGQITIKLTDRAIVNHQLFVLGNADFHFSISYRKNGDYYFPYLMQGKRKYDEKMMKGKRINQSNEIVVSRINLTKPEPFANNMKLWEPAAIPYLADFWNRFSPTSNR